MWLAVQSVCLHQHHHHRHTSTALCKHITRTVILRRARNIPAPSWSYWTTVMYTVHCESVHCYAVCGLSCHSPFLIHLIFSHGIKSYQGLRKISEDSEEYTSKAPLSQVLQSRVVDYEKEPSEEWKRISSPVPPHSSSLSFIWQKQRKKKNHHATKVWKFHDSHYSSMKVAFFSTPRDIFPPVRCFQQ